MAQAGRGTIPPYVSFKTFQTFMEWLIDGEDALPARIDRSFWSQRLSGASGPQLLGALRFLNLVNERDEPEPLLEEIAQDKTVDQRDFKRILRQLLEERYTVLEGLDLQRGSADQFRERFQQYGIEGDTLRKSIAFFVHASQFAGMEISPHVANRARQPRKADGSRKKRQGPKEQPAVVPASPIELAGNVTLQDHRPPPLVQAAYDELLKIGPKWSPERMKAWTNVWEAVVWYHYPPVERPSERHAQGQLGMDFQVGR